VALGWYLLLFPIAVAVVQKVRWWGAAVVGAVTLAVVGLWMFVFIR
jgi:hypothetical protein